MFDLINEQLEALQNKYPQARLERLDNGAYAVIIPDVKLNNEWSKPATTVRFYLPLGYPLAKPVNFFLDEDLRLSDGFMPRSSNIYPLPEAPLREQAIWPTPIPGPYGLWMGLKVYGWKPNNSSIYSYMTLIGLRLQFPHAEGVDGGGVYKYIDDITGEPVYSKGMQ